MPENPLDFLKNLLPPLPFGNPFGSNTISAGPPNPLELIQKLLPPMGGKTITGSNRSNRRYIGAVSSQDDDVEVF